MSVCNMISLGVPEVRKGCRIPMELELQIVVSHLIGAGTKSNLGSQVKSLTVDKS